MIQTDWFERWAGYAPIKAAIREADSENEWSYAKIHQVAKHYASVLRKDHQCQKGDRIAVLADFCPEYIVLFAVAQKLGVILVPLNFRLTPPELSYIIGNAQPSLIFTTTNYQDLLPDELDCQVEPIEQIGSLSLPNLRGQEDDFINPALSDPLFILYTSGTTGFPKGAIYTHQMAFWNSVNTQLRLDITANDHTITCMPPFHTGGWNVLLTPFMHHGGSVTLMKKFDADEVLQKLEEEEATLFMGVPTMLKMMAESPYFDKVKLEALRYFIVGGEAMPIPLIRKWQEKGIPIRQGYGLTEVGPNVTSLHHDDALRKIGSIGKPNFYIQTRLVNAEGKEAITDEEGELWLRGPMVTPGYWDNEEETQKSIADGWFKTGDVLTADSEGYLFVTDRIKNMYISGGENVYPAELEKVIQQHDEVREVAVFAVPDEKWGEVGKALIISKSSKIEVEELVSHCKERLAKFKVPKYFEFVSEIPKTDSGKIDRKKLKEFS
jgi:fatty-acyl-CoA synthase